MIRKLIKRCAIALAAWLPFFAIWLLVAVSFARDRFSTVLVGSLISVGGAGLLGIAVWYVCRRWPWPLGFKLNFYLFQIFFAAVYGIAWTASIYGLESLRARHTVEGFWSWAALGRQTLMGAWFYAVFAGISHAVQTRNRLHEKETLAARAEALAAAARLDAIRARLNPHFLFNALHTLAALVKFRPNVAEGAIERLGDMLRYILKEEGRELVEFSEEYDFTLQYLAFEQLRYEDRLKVDLQIDQESFNFDLPPFSIQTLAENAVQHAIAVRPEGGSIWIKCSCGDGRLQVTVRDDGPGQGLHAGASHQFGLRSLRERLQAAYGSLAELRVQGGVDGFEASFIIPCRGGIAFDEMTRNI
jgi:two-component system, LytTR family, sensor kinase